MEEKLISKILEDIDKLDLTVHQLSKKYNKGQKEMENTLKGLEKQKLIEIDYYDEEVGNDEILEVIMNLYVTNKGKKLINNP